MKPYSSANFLSPQDNMFLKVTENKFIVWNYHSSGPSSIYLFEFSNINGRKKCKLCSKSLKLTIGAPNINLVFLCILYLFWYLRYQGTLPTIQCNLGKIWKTHPPRCPKNIFSEILHITLLHLILNRLNEVNISLLT